MNEEEAEIVRKLFIWVGKERVSIGETARRLSEMSIITQTGKEYWNRSTVWQILKNPAYTGQAAYGKRKVGPKLLTVRPARGKSRRNHSIYSNGKENWIYISVPKIIIEKGQEHG